MPILSRAISFVSLAIFLMVAQVIYAANIHSVSAAPEVTSTVVSSAEPSIEAESNTLYEEMSLGQTGLARKAFDYAYKGYKHLLAMGVVTKQNIISVIDFSQSSRNKRLYVIDVESKEIVMNTFVAHGRNSGKEFASTFSNSMSSLKSSLGFYLTRGTYYGEHGLSLRIDGVEKGINNNAEKRGLVVHGAEYLGDGYLNGNPFSGRSWGCPAVPAQFSGQIINTIKDGSVMFIYHPSKQYLSKSPILNG